MHCGAKGGQPGHCLGSPQFFICLNGGVRAASSQGDAVGFGAWSIMGRSRAAAPGSWICFLPSYKQPDLSTTGSVKREYHVLVTVSQICHPEGPVLLDPNAARRFVLLGTTPRNAHFAAATPSLHAAHPNTPKKHRAAAQAEGQLEMV